MDDLTALLNGLASGAMPGVGVYEWRVQSDRLVWSAGMLDIFGLEEAPNAERGFTIMVHPDDRVRVEATTSAHMETGAPYEHEFRIVRPDGEIRIVHDRGVVERDAEGRVVAMRGLNFDVTAQRSEVAEAAAEPGVAKYDFDIVRGVASWSPEAFRLFALPPSDHVRPFEMARQTVHEDDVGSVIEGFERACRAVGPYRIEYRVRRSDGAVRHILDEGVTLGPLDPVNGVALRARGTLTDITGIESSRRPPEAAGETFHQLVDRLPFGVYTVDADFRIVDANEGARKAFSGVPDLVGCSLDKALGVLWPKAFVAEACERFRRTLETGESYVAPPLVERRRDIGTVEAYDWRLAPVTMPDGRRGVVCHFYDLSTREAEANALREAAERLELAHEAGGMGAWDLDLRSDHAVWTAQMRRLIGVDEDAPASSALFFEKVHPEDRPGLAAAFGSAIEAGVDFDREFRIVLPDGEIRNLVGRGRVIEKDAAGPVRMIGINYDVTERRRAERRIRESEALLRLVLDNSVAFMAVLEPSGEMAEVNATALEAGGVTREEVLGRLFHETPWWSHDPTQASRVKDSIAEARGGKVVRYDVVVRMRGDTRMIVDMMLAPIRDREGRTLRIVASGVDVTDREAASDQTRVLMREINHRSKNLLTLVQVIARRTRDGDPEDFHERFERRLISLAGAQDLLVRDESDGARLDELVRSQLGHFSDLVGSRIIVEGPSIRLDSDAAQYIGMAMHELATNAGKYGALSTEGGTVRLVWRLDGDGPGGRRLAVEWLERGGPPAEPPARTGFGTVVIERLVRDALSAEVSLGYGPEGFSWRAVCATGFAPD